MSWVRRQEEQTRPARPWLESPHELEERLQQAADWANKEFDARGLCMGLPDRRSAGAVRVRGLVKGMGG